MTDSKSRHPWNRRSWSRHPWWAIGAAAWAGVAALYTVVLGFRRLDSDLPWAVPGWQLANIVVMVASGALLSALLLPLLARARPALRHPMAVATLYVGGGMAYLTLWSLTLAGLTHLGLMRRPAPPSPFGSLLLEAAIGMALVGSALFAIMALLVDAEHHRREALREELEAAALEAAMARAETAALRARVDGPFLDSTLALAAGLMDRDPRAARRVLADLGELLRVSLGAGDEQLITLADEIRLLRRYLEITRARLGGSLTLALDVEAPAADCLVPPLVTAPLLEPLLPEPSGSAAAAVELSLEARVVAGRLQLRITLAGGAAGAPAALATHGAVRERLRLLFGDGADVRCARRSNDGAELALELPAVSSQELAS